MMADGPAGFYFDELNKVRVLEPEISTQTQELKEECKEFVDSKYGVRSGGSYRAFHIMVNRSVCLVLVFQRSPSFKILLAVLSTWLTLLQRKLKKKR